LARFIQILLQLQGIDQEWDEKGRVYQATRQRLSDHAPLEARREAQRLLQERLAAAHARLRDADLELGSLNAKSQEIEQSLYSGRVRSPRELEGLEQDRQLLRKRISQVEDQVLNGITENDELEAATKCDAEELLAFETQWNSERQTLNTQYQALRARLQQLQPLREKLRSALPRAELALYDDLRAKKAGVALAPIKGGICQICRVTMPSLKIQDIERGESVITCEGCGRILYQS
jgi:uncharacterized protein